MTKEERFAEMSDIDLVLLRYNTIKHLGERPPYGELAFGRDHRLIGDIMNELRTRGVKGA